MPLKYMHKWPMLSVFACLTAPLVMVAVARSEETGSSAKAVSEARIRKGISARKAITAQADKTPKKAVVRRQISKRICPEADTAVLENNDRKKCVLTIIENY